MNILIAETINNLLESQLLSWLEAKTNFDRLQEIKRKPIELGDLKASAQLNPARIRSTGAAVDSKSISERPCFLCAHNRPKEQMSAEWPDANWELLVNPYPILPVHFTIVSKEHKPQGNIPVEMAMMAECSPDLAIFYNGAHAGASAPDHAHCQAMLKSELPIIALAEKFHFTSEPGWKSSENFGADLPFHFLSAIITPDMEGMLNLAKVSKAFGIDGKSGEKDYGLVNAFFWISDTDKMLRIIIIPRKAHRPSLYYAPEDKRFIISPGAVDMAGILIVPRAEDYNRMSAETARQIYAETAFADGLPEELLSIFINGNNYA